MEKHPNVSLARHMYFRHLYLYLRRWLRQSIKENRKKGKKKTREKTMWQKKGAITCPIFVAKTYFEYDENFSHSRSARFFAVRCTLHCLILWWDRNRRRTVPTQNFVSIFTGKKKKRERDSEGRSKGLWRERGRDSTANETLASEVVFFLISWDWTRPHRREKTSHL